jgi:hypothetical protein
MVFGTSEANFSGERFRKKGSRAVFLREGAGFQAQIFSLF